MSTPLKSGTENSFGGRYQVQGRLLEVEYKNFNRFEIIIYVHMQTCSSCMCTHKPVGYMHIVLLLTTCIM